MSSSPPLSLSERSRSATIHRPSVVSAHYASATVDPTGASLWTAADGKAADDANNPEVRRTLRNRARFECLENNSYGKGIVHTLANDTVGNGPVLRMSTPSERVNRLVERLWAEWCDEINLAAKLRTARVSKAVDGEAVGLIVRRDNNDSPAKMGVCLVEADMLSTPTLTAPQPGEVDGIRYDADGEPIEYHLLPHHPQGQFAHLGGYGDFDRWPAAAVMHAFRQDRPGQHRGIPEVTPALPLFALLRDYTRAVLETARTQAKFTGVLETQAGLLDQDDRPVYDGDVQAFDAVEVDINMLAAMPAGYSLKQFKAEQPTTTFSEFRTAILAEIARCVHMPINVAAGDSSNHNYASGRLDHQTYEWATDIERGVFARVFCEPLFRAFLAELAVVPGVLPAEFARMTARRSGFRALPAHEWAWSVDRPHVDPKKHADGQRIRLTNGTSSRVREYAAQGRDVDREDEIAAASFGVSVADYRKAIFASLFGAGSPAESDDEPEEASVDEDE